MPGGIWWKFKFLVCFVFCHNYFILGMNLTENIWIWTRPVSTTRVSVFPPSKVSTRMMNLMTGYTVTWRTCVCVCVCMYMYTVLIQCVCNRFLCKWLDAWSSPMLFAYDPVYNVCIVTRWEVILPRHTAVESSKVTYVISYTHTPSDDFNACMASIQTRLELWTLMHSLKVEVYTCMEENKLLIDVWR